MNGPNSTTRMYQAGLSLEEAQAKGADMVLFGALEAKYKGGSIPLCDLLGFKTTAPYSCDFHTGGVAGAKLREIAKERK